VLLPPLVGAFGVPRGERLGRLPPPRAYPGERLPVGAVAAYGGHGPGGARGGSGRGHRPLGVALPAPGGPDRGAQRHGRGDDLGAPGPRDGQPVRVPGRFASHYFSRRFAYRFACCFCHRFCLGLCVPL
ncbi:MAG: hypothetical protein AVDCRST_MAG55-2113, partial [uncultured Rubrobacteraceae bacterium]